MNKHLITHVALDAHKKEHQVAMLLPGEDQPEEWRVANTGRAITRLVRRVAKKAPGPVVFCYEAGCCGFALKRQIEAEGARCKVIAPSLTPVKPGERIKTNRRDARKLVFSDRAGLLTEVRAPDEAQEAVRDLCRAREAAQQDLTRARHRLSKFLLRRAVAYCDGRHWTQKHVAWLRQLEFAQPLDAEVFEYYRMEVEQRTARVDELTKAVARAAEQEPYREPVGWLRCLRGFDTVTAMVMVTELYGFERFRSPRELMGYLGLVPSEHSSMKVRRGGITKTGNRRVRRMLIEAAWHQQHAVRVSKALGARRVGQPSWVIAIADRAMRRLHRRYSRLVYRGKLPTVAVTAVARELAGVVWAILWQGKVAPGAATAQETSAGRRAPSRGRQGGVAARAHAVAK